MLSKSLIQFSVDGHCCVPSLLFDLRPNYGGGNEDNGDLTEKVPCTHCLTHCPQTCSRPLLTHASSGDSWTLTGKSESVFSGSLLLSPGSWCTQGPVCALQESVSPVLCKFWQFYGGVNCTIALISQASKVMLKILQARLQQYMDHEPPDVQAGFRKGRGYYHM